MDTSFAGLPLLRSNTTIGFACPVPATHPYVASDINVLNPCFISLAQATIAIVSLVAIWVDLYRLKSPIKIDLALNKISFKHAANLAIVFATIATLVYQLTISSANGLNAYVVKNAIWNTLYMVFGSLPLQFIQYYKTPAVSTSNIFYNIFSLVFYMFRVYQNQVYNKQFAVLPAEFSNVEILLLALTACNLFYELFIYVPVQQLQEFWENSKATGGDYPPCNIFQEVTFTWMNPFVTEVFKNGKVVDPYNMPVPPCHLDAREANASLKLSWADQLWKRDLNNSSAIKTKQPTILLFSLWKSFGWTVTVAIMYECVADVLNSVQPMFLRYFLKSFTKAGSDYPILNSFVLSLSMFLITVLATIFHNQFFIIIFEAGLSIRSSLMTMLYQKALVLSQGSRDKKTTGDILNMMSVDVLNIQRFFENSQSIVGVPLSFVIVMYTLYNLMGVAMLGGLVAMAIMIPVNSKLSSITSSLYEKNLKYKDMRSKLMTEILNSIKSIKLYGWEEPMLAKLRHIRNDLELRNYLMLNLYNNVIFFCWTLVPLFVSVSSFIAYSKVTGEPLTADIIFPALALFDMLGEFIYAIPDIITEIIETKVSLNRLQEFLLFEETSDTFVINEGKSKDSNLPEVEIKDASFIWSVSTEKEESKDASDHSASENDESTTMGVKYALKNINFKAQKSSLTCIVGRVASGKTTLLKAILGSMNAISSDDAGLKQPQVIHRFDSIAYCPQQPWIMNASIKDNIVFGYRYDEKIYQTTLKACQLLRDLEIWADGDGTIVGERGISLSGGQKARIALARAVYSRADVYLLDDVLSAVDAEVGKNIITEVLSRETGLLKNKTVILSTNSIKILKDSDLIYALQDGSIAEVASYNEAVSKTDEVSVLQKLIEEFGQQLETSAAVEESDLSTSGSNKINEFTGKEDTVVSDTVLDESVLEDTIDVNLNDVNNASDISELKSIISRRVSVATYKPNRVLIEQENDNRKTKQKAESKKEGRVSIKVYIVYAKACGIIGVSVFFFFMFLTNAFTFLEKWWLKIWSDSSEDANETMHGLIYYVGIYGIISMLASSFAVIRSLCMTQFSAIKAARKLHDGMANSVLRAPMQFFETTPLGRITNRFASDISTIDQGLQFILSFFFRQLLNYLTTVVVLTYVMPSFFLLNAVLVCIYYYYQKYYVVMTRDLKRLMSISFSPIMSVLSESLVGEAVIGAFDQYDRFNYFNYENIQFNVNCVFNFRSTNRWLSVRLEMVGALIILFTASFCCFSVVSGNPISSGMVGLLMSYAMQVSGSLMWLVRMYTQVETNIVSVERILEYTELAPEAPMSVEHNDSQLPENWPEHGEVVFEEYSTTYRKELDPSLRGVSFKINPGEKVGICGRSGSGKSTLTLGLFRILEPLVGKISIDGVDISKLGLQYRKKLSIIPQEGNAFEGTVRYNLDPFDEYTDDELVKALELSHLKPHIEKLCKEDLDLKPENQSPEANVETVTDVSIKDLLETKISDNGSNLSSGTKQLLCLARALLNKSKVLVLDEATSSVDAETDKIIQETIRSEFKDKTILSVAHRLDSILDNDKIIVLEGGELKEFDSPANLIDDKTSIFYSLCKKGGYLKSSKPESSEEK
ncbi:hypothetical protein QEN19_004021 [Hanseniaspora menglaensis]